MRESKLRMILVLIKVIDSGIRRQHFKSSLDSWNFKHPNSEMDNVVLLDSQIKML